MGDVDGDYLKKKNFAPFVKSLEYHNEFDEDPTVRFCIVLNCPSKPTLYVPKIYDLESDISSIVKGNFWTFVLLSARRPATYREILIEKLVAQHEDTWYLILKPHFFDDSSGNYFQNFTFNAFVRSGAELDAYYLYYAHICHGLPESRGSLYIEVIQEMPRDMEFNFNEVGVDLFTTKTYYKRNKEKFIEIFSRTSFMNIRKMTEHFLLKNKVDICERLGGYFPTLVQKCARSVCKKYFDPGSYCADKNQFFAKRLRKYIVENDLYGIVRIIISRSEIDLYNIIVEYVTRYSRKYIRTICQMFTHESKLYDYLIKILCGLEPDEWI
ncbi:hypothetical protein RF11_12362 [Thelohanellus kitauei]|uniref:Uncharacterized protein n=1 Tax=Thelohanellus kitauei TaxID=669202 RepID=A0A0C2N980_THEKT|nr:hypothetical protein RF11_12362 [Thelohanellus kitauei]